MFSVSPGAQCCWCWAAACWGSVDYRESELWPLHPADSEKQTHLHPQPGSAWRKTQSFTITVFLGMREEKVKRGSSHHVLDEGSLSLAATQREDGGGRQRAEVPQWHRRTPTTQLKEQIWLLLVCTVTAEDLRLTCCDTSQKVDQACFLTIQSESVVRQLIHLPYCGLARL